MSEAFDVIPYEDLAQPFSLLGTGSFGSVYKSNYLGTPVALKQILPSTEYDVHKYFEREWRLMKEARHPNVVLYLGLCKAPDKVIYIISEFIEGGNMRNYIFNKRKPFPWTMRISFATDVARSLAYLHARKCIHRDLKPENLLLTSNGRVKITDFGFARIAPRSPDEIKRLTFCGTDAYMSPGILMGDSFGLSTDIFSLGIIFCEIISRKLADDTHFRRSAPDWGVDPSELRGYKTKECPDAFIALAIDCLNLDPNARPDTREVLDRLRAIEIEVFDGEKGGDAHVGSIKFVTGKRPSMAPRIPSFGMGAPPGTAADTSSVSEEDGSDDDEELEAALKALEVVKMDSDSAQPLLATEFSPDPSSILTIKASPTQNELAQAPMQTSRMSVDEPATHTSMMSIDSFHTAISTISIAGATIGGSSIPSSSSLNLHRFTMIKPRVGAKRSFGDVGQGRPTSPPKKRASGSGFDGWNPLEFFTGALFGSKNKGSASDAKCDLCGKRLGLGWKTVLECDDCGLRAHLKCGEFAPKDCGLRPTTTTTASPVSPKSPRRGLLLK